MKRFTRYLPALAMAAVGGGFILAGLACLSARVPVSAAVDRRPVTPFVSDGITATATIIAPEETEPPFVPVVVRPVFPPCGPDCPCGCAEGEPCYCAWKQSDERTDFLDRWQWVRERRAQLPKRYDPDEHRRRLIEPSQTLPRSAGAPVCDPATGQCFAGGGACASGSCSAGSCGSSGGACGSGGGGGGRGIFRGRMRGGCR